MGLKNKSKVKELEEYIMNLQVARDLMQQQQNGTRIHDHVKHWFEKVNETIFETEDIVQGEKMAYCSNGFLSKLGSKHQLSEKAKNIKRDVDQLLQQAKKLEESKKSFASGNEIVNMIMNAMRDLGVRMNGAYGLNEEENRTLVRQITSKKADDIVQEYDQSFYSRNTTLEKIIEALKDPEVKVIGINGQGGMGKTTLAKEVARRAREGNLFDKVGMISISRNSNTKKIQSQIADEMELKLEEENVFGRAQILADLLFRQKKSLVILDDLWEKIGLGNIPYLDSDVFTSKILLTSRSNLLLSKYVDEKYIFPVGVLEEKEAHTLLRKVGGVVELQDSSFESLVDQFTIKTCALSPYLIISIGSYLRGKSCCQWKIALEMLQEINFTEFALQDMQFPTELSFGLLEDLGLRDTFLLCAQMGHHPFIMDFVKYYYSLNVFRYLMRSHTLISKLIPHLKEINLLLDSNSSDRVIIPNKVRDYALSIASQYNFFALQNGKLEKWPNKSELESCTTIFFHSSVIIKELPKDIYCPQLMIFHFESNDPSLKVPDNFFEGMKELRVLELIGFQLPILPPSISCLKNLRTFYLERCLLCGNLSIIGKLKKLRILSVAGSEIECLPNELGELNHLEFFDISSCPTLKVIPPKVLSRLDWLENFHTRSSLIQWWVEGQDNQSQNANLAELSQLHQLKILEIDCPDVAALPTNVLFDKLEMYKVVMGDSNQISLDAMEILNDNKVSKSLAILQLKEGFNSQEKIKTTFKGSVENLLLGKLNGIQNVFKDMNLKEFSYLKHLSILNNLDVQYIINSEDLLEVFPELESLCLVKMPNIEKIICCNELADNSFGNLKTIKIQKCARLKNLFSISLTRMFPKLDDTFEVFEGHSMEEIVGLERQENNIKEIGSNQFSPSSPFQNLMQLDVIDCGSLRHLLSFSMAACLANLNKLSIIGCEMMEEIIAEEINTNEAKVNIFPKLKELHLLCMERLATIWHSQGGPKSYSMLNSMVIEECKNLVTIFPSHMVGNPNLVKLKIVNCPSVEDIFDIKDTMQLAKVSICPKLEEFYLNHMESLTTIWHMQGGPDSYNMLNYVVIEECTKLVKIFPNHTLEKIPLLITLKVVNCHLVEEIFDINETQRNVAEKETCLRFIHIEGLPNLKHIWNRDPEGILNFKYLKKIWVSKCSNLKNLMPVFIASGFEYIESLTIRDCNTEEIVCRE